MLLSIGLLLPAVGSAHAGDLKAAQRSVRSARTALETGRTEETTRRLDDAAAALDGIDDEAAAELRGEIESLRGLAATAERERSARQIEKECERNLDAARTQLERNGGTRGDPNVAEMVEGPLQKVRDRLQVEDARSDLSAESRAAIEKKIDDLRNAATAAAADIRFHRVAGWVEKVEKVNAGDDEEAGNREMVLRWIEMAEQELADAPSADPRHAGYESRLDSARRGFAALVDAAEREDVIVQAVTFWRTIVEAYGPDSEGFAEERAPSYPDFLASGSLSAPRTEKRYELVERVRDQDVYTRAIDAFPDDPRLVEVVDEVRRVTEESGGKLCVMANELLEQAEADDQSSPERVVFALKQLEQTVAQNTLGADAHADTAARVRALIERIEEDAAARLAAIAAAREACEAAAAQAWPQIVASFPGAASIDPVACVDDIGAFEGRVVRLTKSNRAGWDYETADYDYIAAINGVPVAGRFDGALRGRIRDLEKRTGLTFEPNDIEDVIGVVDGTCRVMQIEYSQITREHYNVANFKAPLLRITAVRGGPFALSNDGGMDVDELVAAIGSPDADGGSGAGLVSFALLALGIAGLGFVRRRDPRVVVALARLRGALSASRSLGSGAYGSARRTAESAWARWREHRAAPARDAEA